MRNLKEYTERYRHLYKNKEKFYHNFEHVRSLIYLLHREFQEEINMLNKFTPIYYFALCEAIMLHDVGHLCGDQKNDRENVDIALSLIKNKNLVESEPTRSIVLCIVDATCFPHCSVQEVLNKHNVDKDDRAKYELAINVMRDLDLIGIGAHESDLDRKNALTGMMAEYYKTSSREKLLHNCVKATDNFFRSVIFNTISGKSFAKKNNNFQNLRDWQRVESKDSILLASS